MTLRNGSSISYTSYNLPSVINAGAGYSSTLSYGAFRNRYKQIAVTPTSTETTIYVAGLLEKVTRGGSIEYRHLIHGGQGAAAIHTRVVGGASLTYYLHRDHLGSPELITDSSGLEVVRPSFGAYGERRDGTDWSGPPSTADLTDIANTIRRGFTGHEHLDSVGLIHMNGRVYEPVAGRFLGVDPIVQLGSSQSPNRYSYVWNNPLSLIDPSGFFCEPSPEMSEEEASAWITQCTDAYDEMGRYMGRYGVGITCAFGDHFCQQRVIAQQIAEQNYSNSIFSDMRANREGFDWFNGNEILVTASRLGGEETMTWVQSRLNRDPFADTWVSATLPDGSRGYMPATSASQGPARPTSGPLPGQNPPGVRADGQGLVAATGALNTTLEFVAEIERSPAVKLLGRSGVALGYLEAGMAFRRGDYTDAAIGGVLTSAALGAVLLGYPLVATGLGAASITYLLITLAAESN